MTTTPEQRPKCLLWNKNLVVSLANTVYLLYSCCCWHALLIRPYPHILLTASIMQTGWKSCTCLACHLQVHFMLVTINSLRVDVYIHTTWTKEISNENSQVLPSCQIKMTLTLFLNKSPNIWLANKSTYMV